MQNLLATSDTTGVVGLVGEAIDLFTTKIIPLATNNVFGILFGISVAGSLVMLFKQTKKSVK